MEYVKYAFTALGGIGLTMLGQYLFSKIKHKIDFSEEQQKVNADLDKRISILEERTKKI